MVLWNVQCKGAWIVLSHLFHLWFDNFQQQMEYVLFLLVLHRRGRGEQLVKRKWGKSSSECLKHWWVFFAMVWGCFFLFAEPFLEMLVSYAFLSFRVSKSCSSLKMLHERDVCLTSLCCIGNVGQMGLVVNSSMLLHKRCIVGVWKRSFQLYIAVWTAC